MIRRYRLLAGMVLPLCGGAVPPAVADGGIPALLQFAEQYQEKTPAAPAEKPAIAPEPRPPGERKTPVAAAPVKKPVAAQKLALSAATAKTLHKQETQLRAQQAMIAQLQQQLQAKTSPSAPATDFRSLSPLMRSLRQALAITPSEQQAAEQLRRIQAREAEASRRVAEVKQENATLQAQLRALSGGVAGAEATRQRAVEARQKLQADIQGLKALIGAKETALAANDAALKAARQQVQQLTATLQAQRQTQSEQKDKNQRALAALKQGEEDKSAALQKQLTDLTATHTALISQTEQRETEIKQDAQARQTLEKQLAAADKTQKEMTAQLTVKQQKVAQLETDVAALRSRAKLLVSPAALKTPTGSQAYAAGVSLGRDIQSMLAERQGWGMKTDRQTLLSGIVDTFAGQYQLTQDVLEKALAEAEAEVDKARAQAGQTAKQRGEAFLTQFKQEKGVKKAAGGFWYRVDYAGDAVLPEEAIVDVVVKESLTDGTVIQDMGVTGKVLSQPLSAYPPLFQEAIGQLKNHGSITLVVPPALAYGEAGYPPLVPPNATMVYELRIDNSRAAPGK